MKLADTSQHVSFTLIADAHVARVLDASPLGIIEVDLSGRLLFVNAKAMEIWGISEWRGKTLRDLFSDTRTYDQIQFHVANRKRGLSEEYEIEITRLSDQHQIPIRIAGWPVTDEEGRVRGAISIIRSMEVAHAIRGFNKYIAEAKSSSELLAGIAEETCRILPIDFFAVGEYSRNMKSSRPLFVSPSGVLSPDKRWYRFSDKFFAWVQKNEQRVHINLQQLYSETQDESVRQLMNSGFVDMIRCPIRAQNRLVGSISLMTKKSTGFSAAEVQMSDQLPLAKAALAALHLESQRDLEFRLRLVENISNSQNDAQAYQSVVNGIANRYEWSYVSILLIDYSQKSLALMSQYGNPGRIAPAGFKTRIEDEVWQKVFERKSRRVISDERLNTLFVGMRQEVVRSSVSMGISSGESIYAILNIEDEAESAISEDDKRILRSILDELGHLIDRQRRDNLARAAFRSTPLAIFVTDGKGAIQQANPAAEKLFGRNDADLSGRSILEFVSDSHRMAVQEMVDSSRNIDLVLPSGAKPGYKTLPVSIVISRITDVEDRRLIAIRDLSLEKKASELQELADVYLGLAREMKTPLSMMGILLEDLKRGTKGAFVFGKTQRILDETIDAARSQLRKVELTYDQLLLRSTKATKVNFLPVSINLRQFIEGIRNEFPEMERKRIILSLPQETEVYVRGDPALLAFLFETILGYAIRCSPSRQLVGVELKPKTTTAALEITASYGPDSNSAGVSTATQLVRSKIMLDIALGKPALVEVARVHDGHFQGPTFENKSVSFTVVLPIIPLSN